MSRETTSAVLTTHMRPVVMRRSGASSVDQFCADHCLSRRTYYNMRNEGIGPEEMKVGRRVLISDEAAARWRAAREAAE